jgi:hypothetical protein
MSGATRSTPSLYLPDVERHHQPGICHDLIAAARDRNQEYSKITTCALFNFYNRWITASGVPVMSADSHRAQGKALASRGYIRD